MSTVTIPTSCQCGSIGRSDLRQCPDHFHIWNGDRRLTSVGSIIRSCWPQGPLPPADVLENARDRGEVTDKLAAAYVSGKLTKIPAGTRRDAVDLFFKFRQWFDKQKFKKVEVQVVLGNLDYGGVLDFRFDGVPVELKCTYELSDIHRMQAAAYAALLDRPAAYLLHITERISEPRLIPLSEIDYDDWRTLLSHWRMVTRRLGVGINRT